MVDSLSLFPLFIIILNWNLPADTIACVRSVERACLALTGETKIVIVDNGSTDDSLIRFRDELGSAVQLVESPLNLGFAGGMNLGMRWSLEQGAAALLLLNNDTVIDPAMIRQLLAVAGQQPQARVVGPAIFYHAAPDRLWKAGDQESAWLPIPRTVSAQFVAAQDTTPFAVDYLTGCAMLIPRKVLESVGLFDQRFFMYYEDADLCRRIRDAGFAIWCAPAAKMWHKVSLSAQKDKPMQRYWQSWGRVQFYKLHPHGSIPGLIHLYLFGKALSMTLRDMVEGDWQLLMPLWKGMLNGYRTAGNASIPAGRRASRDAGVPR